MKKKKRILVIGSNGFVGTSFCNFLEKNDNEVIRFDIKRSPEEDARINDLNLQLIDQVYFLAWDVGGAKYLYDKKTQVKQMDWNVQLMQNVFDQLYTSRKDFVFTSSQLAQDIETVYGISKRLGEVWSREIGGRIVRFWNVYGPLEPDSIKSHVVSDIVLQAIRNQKIHLLTNGQEKRQFIHIDDICRGLITAMDANPGIPYDLTTYRWQTINDVASIISGYTNSTIVCGNILGKTPVTPYAAKLPCWEATISTEEGLKQMVLDAQGV